jgi:hypothetical protein
MCWSKSINLWHNSAYIVCQIFVRVVTHFHWSYDPFLLEFCALLLSLELSLESWLDMNVVMTLAGLISLKSDGRHACHLRPQLMSVHADCLSTDCLSDCLSVGVCAHSADFKSICPYLRCTVKITRQNSAKQRVAVRVPMVDSMDRRS